MGRGMGEGMRERMGEGRVEGREMGVGRRESTCDSWSPYMRLHPINCLLK